MCYSCLKFKVKQKLFQNMDQDLENPAIGQITGRFNDKNKLELETISSWSILQLIKL
jgi:hypothetical protein